MFSNETIKKMQAELDLMKQDQYEKLCAEYNAIAEKLIEVEKKLKDLGHYPPSIECTTCGDKTEISTVCKLCE